MHAGVAADAFGLTNTIASILLNQEMDHWM